MQEKHRCKSMPNIEELELVNLLKIQCTISTSPRPRRPLVPSPVLGEESDVEITGKKRERSYDEIEALQTIPPAKCATKIPNVKVAALSAQVAALLGRMLESACIAPARQ